MIIYSITTGVTFITNLFLFITNITICERVFYLFAFGFCGSPLLFSFEKSWRSLSHNISVSFISDRSLSHIISSPGTKHELSGLTAAVTRVNISQRGKSLQAETQQAVDLGQQEELSKVQLSFCWRKTETYILPADKLHETNLVCFLCFLETGT